MPMVCPICNHETKVFKCENCKRSFQLEPEHTESQQQIAREAVEQIRDYIWQQDQRGKGRVFYDDKEFERIILSAIEQATKAQTTILGFASWKDGRFELIVRDEESCEETTLKGQLDAGQFEQVSKILPTCVMIRSESRAAPASAEQQEHRLPIECEGDEYYH